MNTGSNAAVASFVLPAPLTGMQAAISTIDFATAGPAVPEWWRFASGPTNCRAGLLSSNLAISGSAVNCQDWALGFGVGGFSNYAIGFSGPSTATANSQQVAAGSALNVVAGQEYFTFNLVVSNQKTIGTGSCSGCAVPACIALRQVAIDLAATPGFPDVVLTSPLNGTDSNYLTWQGGVGSGPLPGGACPAATPTRNSTWGAVKSLYR